MNTTPAPTNRLDRLSISGLALSRFARDAQRTLTDAAGECVATRNGRHRIPVPTEDNPTGLYCSACGARP